METPDSGARKPVVLTGMRAIAEHLGVKESTARHWHIARLLPTFQMAGLVCARDVDLDQAMIDRAAKGEREPSRRPRPTIESLTRRRDTRPAR